ncbi:hypothetical protein [Lichenifustis flavocetrariae]|uniref:Uncharacterized protein n=1 Tax=Lichenifustis flavocetrariae TaxID=2949735 RepID=A0AA41Z3F7_9HYPH|nr:hypothetical protein [Lichenifustis flavocetrariae]MCW6508577.1 hypothetical protein [Lichenifustis flavocetrariae]
MNAGKRNIGRADADRSGYTGTMILFARRLLLIPMLAMGLTPASADSFKTPALKQGSPLSIQGYGRQNPGCLEWTNGCVICASSDGHAACSTPGIACTPAGLTCKRHAKP